VTDTEELACYQRFEERLKRFYCVSDNPSKEWREEFGMKEPKNYWVGKIKSALDIAIKAQRLDKPLHLPADFYSDKPDLEWIIQMLAQDGFLHRVKVEDGEFPYKITTKGLALYMVVSELWLPPEDLERMSTIAITTVLEHNAFRLLTALTGTVTKTYVE